MPRKPKNGAPLGELAALAGVSRSQLVVLFNAGAPRPKKRGDLKSWLPDFHAWKDARRRPPGPAPAAGDEELLRHKRALAALTVARLERQQRLEAGELLPRQTVVDYASAAVLAVNRGLDGMVRRVASLLGTECQGGAARVEAVLQAELNHLRAVFAQGMRQTHENGEN